MSRLAYPWALLGLLLLPALWWWWRQPRATQVLRFSGLSAIRSAGATLRTRLQAFPNVLRTLAFVVLVIAVARPQRADSAVQVTVEGIAIQLILDTSSSMSQWDLSPPGQNISRISIAKNVMARFIGGDGTKSSRDNDLIGLIRFARYPDSVCPFTLDHATLRSILTRVMLVDRAGPEDLTAIGDAVALGVERLRSLKKPQRGGGGDDYQVKSRIIVLLTDGENNAGMVMPADAGDVAATYGIKIYSILVGRISSEGRPTDDTELRRLADVTGGKFYRATDAQLLEKAYADIDQLERSKTERREYVDYEELAGPFILAGFAAVILQGLLESTLLRRIP